MKRIGLDIGTKHIVLAYLDENNNRKVRYEVNGYLSFPRGDSFMEQLLLAQKIPFVTRDDGKGNKEFIAIGKMAEQLAYSLNRTLCRPMAEGGISKYDEDAQEVIAIIIKSIIGKLTEDTIIYYCTTAKPINNQSLNVDFHRKVVKLIIEGYKGEAEIKAFHINEARCLVLKEIVPAIGISWGAGTVTVHAGIFGVPIFEFSVCGSGDWVDVEAAKRFGYDPTHPNGEYVETPTTICRRKEGMDLRKTPEDRVGQAIYLMYEILIENVVKGIAEGFRENKGKFRFDKPVNIVNAGGSSMPDGFIEMFSKKLKDVDLDIPLGEVKRVDNPLFAVAYGCLTAAELHKEEKGNQ